MRRIIWLVLICLIGLGAAVAIKIGARTPEGADVDRAKVGATTTAPWHDIHSSDNSRDISALTSERRGGSAPARPQVKAAQDDAKDSARRSSPELACASDKASIRPMVRNANSSAA
jgi:hypothetical protein